MNEYYELILIPVIVGLLEIVKSFNIDKKFIPIFSICFGLLFVFLVNQNRNIDVNIIDGFIIGLSSVGLYSSGKNIVKR